MDIAKYKYIGNSKGQQKAGSLASGSAFGRLLAQTMKAAKSEFMGPLRPTFNELYPSGPWTRDDHEKLNALMDSNPTRQLQRAVELGAAFKMPIQRGLVVDLSQSTIHGGEPWRAAYAMDADEKIKDSYKSAVKSNAQLLADIDSYSISSLSTAQLVEKLSIDIRANPLEVSTFNAEKYMAGLRVDDGIVFKRQMADHHNVEAAYKYATSLGSVAGLDSAKVNALSASEAAAAQWTRQAMSEMANFAAVPASVLAEAKLATAPTSILAEAMGAAWTSHEKSIASALSRASLSAKNGFIPGDLQIAKVGSYDNAALMAQIPTYHEQSKIALAWSANAALNQDAVRRAMGEYSALQRTISGESYLLSSTQHLRNDLTALTHSALFQQDSQLLALVKDSIAGLNGPLSVTGIASAYSATAHNMSQMLGRSTTEQLEALLDTAGPFTRLARHLQEVSEEAQELIALLRSRKMQPAEFHERLSLSSQEVQDYYYQCLSEELDEGLEAQREKEIADATAARLERELRESVDKAALLRVELAKYVAQAKRQKSETKKANTRHTLSDREAWAAKAEALLKEVPPKGKLFCNGRVNISQLAAAVHAYFPAVEKRSAIAGELGKRNNIKNF